MSQSCKIIVIDDDEAIRDVIGMVLTKRGYRAELFPDGTRALDHIRDNQPQIIICDIELPDINGFKILEKVKALYPDTLFVMMTGYGDTYSVREALISGADEYLSKPFTVSELTLILERLTWRLENPLETSGINDEPAE